MPGSSRAAGGGLALLVTFLWSTSWVLIRWGLDREALTPLVFAGLRYALAGTLLMAWLASSSAGRRELRAISAGELARLAALGLLFYAVTQGAQFVAIAHQPEATTGLVLSLTPLVVALASIPALGERPTARQGTGVVLVTAGAVSYATGNLGATAVGMGAAVVGLAANAAASLMGRSVNRTLLRSATAVTAVSMSIGAAVLLGVGLVVEGAPSFSPAAWAIIAWLAVINTAVAFTLWNRSLRVLTAPESATINNTMTAQIALLAWAFLGERPGLASWIGIGLVSMGALLARPAALQRQNRRSPAGAMAPAVPPETNEDPERE